MDDGGPTASKTPDDTVSPAACERFLKSLGNSNSKVVLRAKAGTAFTGSTPNTRVNVQVASFNTSGVSRLSPGEGLLKNCRHFTESRSSSAARSTVTVSELSHPDLGDKTLGLLIETTSTGSSYNPSSPGSTKTTSTVTEYSGEIQVAIGHTVSLVTITSDQPIDQAVLRSLATKATAKLKAAAPAKS